MTIPRAIGRRSGRRHMKEHYEYLDFVEKMPLYEAAVLSRYGVDEYVRSWLEGDRAAKQILEVRT